MKKILLLLTLLCLSFINTVASNIETCGECDGKISSLSLKYEGDKNALVEVYATKGEELFSKNVSIGETIQLDGFDKRGTLGTKVSLYINGILNADIHTSCSVPILTGMNFGSFLIKDGLSRNGGQICKDESNDNESGAAHHITSNGVFLPMSKLGASIPTTPHIGRHNQAYWDEVNRILETAVSGLPNSTKAEKRNYKWAVINAISEVRLKLLSGQLQVNKHTSSNNP